MKRFSNSCLADEALILKEYHEAIRSWKLFAEPDARANGYACHASCWRTSRAKRSRGSSLTLAMKKADIVAQWSGAISNGTFLVGKHDLTGLSITWDSFRTVLSAEAAASLSGFITSGNYGIRMYEDTKFPASSGYYEIIPSGQASFSVAGSGVASGSLTPSGDYDRLVVAYGKKRNPGWHVYAEDSARIASGVSTGRLNLKYEL